MGFFYFLLGLNCKGAVSIMTLPEQTVEIAVRCQVGRLQGTLFRIKPLPLSCYCQHLQYIYSSSNKTIAQTKRAIITLYNRMPFRLMAFSAVLYHCFSSFTQYSFLVCPRETHPYPYICKPFLSKQSHFFFFSKSCC